MITKLNLNSIVKVELNLFGISIYEEYLNSFLSSNERLLDFALRKVQNGCLELEFWKFCNIFGPYLSENQNPLVSVDSIEIREEKSFLN